MIFKLINNPDYSPEYLINGDRSLKRVNQKFSLKDKIYVLAFQKGESNESSHYKFPLKFQVALSSFKDSITFSVSLYGNLEDKNCIKEFLNKFDSELTLSD